MFNKILSLNMMLKVFISFILCRVIRIIFIDKNQQKKEKKTKFKIIFCIDNSNENKTIKFQGIADIYKSDSY